ncbi:MAG: hypothetical protein KDD43_15845, partial [Bdellovibrionales bacterium]|nr:hypothetical protein [Bdellovibrionales bacterium]
MTMLKLILPILVVSGLVASVHAETSAPVAGAETQAQVPKAEEAKSPWSAGISASYNGGFRDDIDPYMFYELSAGYKLSDSSSLSMVQGVTQLSYVYKGQSEFQSSDTSFALSRTLSKDFYGMSLSGKLKLTVPTSELSQRADILTKPGLSL